MYKLSVSGKPGVVVKRLALLIGVSGRERRSAQ